MKLIHFNAFPLFLIIKYFYQVKAQSIINSNIILTMINYTSMCRVNLSTDGYQHTG